MRNFSVSQSKFTKLHTLIAISLIIHTCSGMIAENTLESFECWLEGDKLAIYYKTTWGNTTIEVSDNTTKLELYKYNFSEEYEIAGEGHSRWWFNVTEGLHIIEAEIFHEENVQFIETHELNLVSVSITINLTSISNFANESTFNLFEWLSSRSLLFKILLPTLTVLVIITIIISIKCKPSSMKK